jgi:hypothetical protein
MEMHMAIPSRSTHGRLQSTTHHRARANRIIHAAAIRAHRTAVRVIRIPARASRTIPVPAIHSIVRANIKHARYMGCIDIIYAREQ